MNEIMNRRYINKVMSLGISKQHAVEIVEASMEINKGNNVEMYIQYAIELQYGLGGLELRKKIQI